jgi:hypothetical protein
MSQLEDPIAEAFARLTMLEFAVEIMLANQLSRDSPTDSAKFREDFIRASKKGYGPMTADEAETRQMLAIARRSEELADRLMEKVRRRADDF